MAEKYYITAKELIGFGFGRDKAYDLLKKVRKELTDQGYEMPATTKAPRQAVLRKLGIGV